MMTIKPIVKSIQFNKTLADKMKMKIQLIFLGDNSLHMV